MTLHNLDDCPYNHCADCGECQMPLERLLLVTADLGDGAFLTMLCETCWWRRQYRAELKGRLRRRL